jgi:hypothetical protein
MAKTKSDQKDIMLVFSHVTDLRASLPSNNFSFKQLQVFLLPRDYVVLANNMSNYTILTNPESCTTACTRNDIILPIYPSMLDTLSVPFCDLPLACPHLFATA